MKKNVTLYTDGACSGNPGPGGYGVILKYQNAAKELSGFFENTTNNRMEIFAVIAGLDALKESCRVTVYTDSRYVIDSMTKGWIERWKAQGWMRNKKERALNVDLWERLLKLCERHEVHFHWVKGHNEHPENERCDQLATMAIKGR
ncbi:MAG: ribonuclease HI [bacterium]